MMDRERFEALCAEHMERQFDRVTKMRELHTGEWIDRDYYVRHLMETVLRIRLNNEVATYALYQVGSKDDELAGAMSRYLYEEFGHEAMFTRDLAEFGVSIDEVNATPEFPSTAKLMGYLQLLAHRDGPAPTVTWDWFVEWYQEQYNPIIVGKAGQTFGDRLVHGWQKHIEFDETHDHDDLMWTVVTRAVEGWSSPERAEAYLAQYINMIGDYFQELYDATVGARIGSGEQTPVAVGAAVEV